MAYTLIGDPVYDLTPSPVIPDIDDGPVIKLKYPIKFPPETRVVSFVNYNKVSKVPVITVNYVTKRKSGSDVMKHFIITDLTDKRPIPFELAYAHNNVIHNAKSLLRAFPFKNDEASKLLVVSLKKVIEKYDKKHPVKRRNLVSSFRLAQKRIEEMKYDQKLIDTLVDAEPRRKMASLPVATKKTHKREHNSAHLTASASTINKAVANIYANYVLDSEGVPEKDLITLSLIPREHAITIENKVYDARGLKRLILNKVMSDIPFLASISSKILVPHTRNAMTITDIISVLKTADY
jgi:hypothetical protein